MTISVDEYRRLREKVENLRTKASRAEGAHEEAVRRLRESGHATIEDAEDAAAAWRTKQRRAEAEFERKMSEFQKKYGDVLK